MKSWLQKHRRVLVILGIILFLGFFFIWVNLSDWGPRSPEMQQRVQFASLTIGKKTWEIANISNYILKIEVHLSEATCYIETEVKKGNQAATIENTCGIDGYVYPAKWSYFFSPAFIRFNLFKETKVPPTVDELFITSEKLVIAREPPQDAPNGRDCDGYWTYSISYDPILGYPRSIQVIHNDPDVPKVHAWRVGFFTAYYCTMLGSMNTYPSYTISVTPLP
jgi:hypothetical protein